MMTSKPELARPAPAPEQVSPPVAGRAARHSPRPRVLRRMLALEDFVDAARRTIPRPIYGYVTGGVETNASLTPPNEKNGPRRGA